MPSITNRRVKSNKQTNVRGGDGFLTKILDQGWPKYCSVMVLGFCYSVINYFSVVFIFFVSLFFFIEISLFFTVLIFF